MDEVLKELKKSGLKHLELMVIDIATKVLPAALDAAKKEIPTEIDDAIIEALKPAIVKAAVELAQKIYEEKV